ncbi:MAG: hypothetical protein LBT05_08090 [Planctomycetaceae bacterium]|nr:hypothetical protein [Planctomycetaceae bacterium]
MFILTTAICCLTFMAIKSFAQEENPQEDTASTAATAVEAPVAAEQPVDATETSVAEQQTVTAESQNETSQTENSKAETPQDEPKAEEPKEESKTEEKKTEEKSPETQASKPVAVIEKEQTVYVPYEKLKNAFESEGRGVFLPYAEFRKLWDAAKELEKPKPVAEPQKSPIAALITATENQAKINGDLVEVTATVKFDLLEPGWRQLPLQLQGAAIIEAKIGNEPAKIIGNHEQGYQLLVERKKDSPVHYELILKYAKTYEKSPGRNFVSFRVPQAPLSRWEFHVPDAGVKVDFVPMIAATEISAEKSENKTKETIFQAFAGSAPNVQIGWTPKSEGATGLAVLANVQSQHLVAIEEGVVRNRVTLNYVISRAQLDKLTVEVPDDQKIVGVADDNVRSWKISQGNKTQVIQVELFEPAKTRQTLLIDMEKFVPVSDVFSLNVPRIHVVGVGGRQGILAVDASPGLAVEQKKSSGLIQIDPAELPQMLKIRDGGFAYRLSAPAYDLELNIEKEQPRIFAKTQTNVTLLPTGSYNVVMQNVYRIEKAGVFQLFYDIPDEYQVQSVSRVNITNNPFAATRSVQSQPQEDSQANVSFNNNIAIDGYQLSDLPTQEGKPKMKRLTVNLARKAIGIFSVNVTLSKSETVKELYAETEKNVDLKIIAPVITAEGIEHKEGIFILYAPNNLRVTPTGFSGMQNVPFDQLSEKWITGPLSNTPALLAYVFANEQPELSLQAMKRTPQVTIKQLLSSRIDDGVIRFTDKISYNVLYSGVKSLRIDVPKEIAKDLRNQSKEFRDTILSPQPEDVAEGYEAWNFAKDVNLIGNGTITLTWEKQIPQLLDGGNVDITIPRLIPQDVFRSWGQILLSKAETVDISASDKNEGLRQIDPQHDVDANDRIQDAAYAFEFHNDWNLSLLATRYQLQEVKRASVEYGVIRTVLTRANTISVQALYRIQSVKQRLPIVLPPDSQFDTEPRINGKPVTLETDAAKQYLIPLTATTPDKPFLLELRYTQKKENVRSERNRWKEKETISIPVFPDEPAVQHLYVAVYLPEEYALASYRGNVSKNFGSSYFFNDRNEAHVFNTPSVETLVNEAQKGTPQNHSWQDFPVGGTPYLFSTVQPDKQTPELLQIVLRKTAAVNAFIFLLALTGGIALTFYPWRIRGIAVFGLAALYALLAFAAPTPMTLVVAMSGLRWAIGLTILVWIAYLFITNREKIELPKIQATSPTFGILAVYCLFVMLIIPKPVAGRWALALPLAVWLAILVVKSLRAYRTQSNPIPKKVEAVVESSENETKSQNTETEGGNHA